LIPTTTRLAACVVLALALLALPATAPSDPPLPMPPVPPAPPYVPTAPVPPVAQPAPSAVTGEAAIDSKGTVTLSGTVGTSGAPTSFWFEYGPTTRYGRTLYPSGRGTAPLTGDGPKLVAGAPVSGLRQGATYHFRIVARNSVGTTAGADVSFRVIPAVLPPPPSPSVSQCKEDYLPGSQIRAQCIKRAERERPGSSCKHPLVTNQTARGPGGDKADFTVELVGYNGDLPPGLPQRVWAVVTLHSSRVIICPKLAIADEPNGMNALRYYYVSVGPQGGMTSAITVPDGSIFPVAFGRLK
jgi:hypothetical protein